MIFKNQTIVITGGASGIGLAVAKKVILHQGTPLLIDKNAEQLVTVKLGSDSNVIKSHADVGNEDQLKKILEEHINILPPIKGLVCSAGKAPIPKRIEDTELSEWNEIIQSHLTGTFLSCKIFGSHMAKNLSGSIVNLSSILGYNSGPVLAYGAAKAAIKNLTAALSTQWADNNVRVNAVAPGFTDTPLLRPKERKNKRDLTPILNSVPQRRLMEADEIAEVICFLLSDNSSSITGATIKCDGGILAGAGWQPYGGFPKKEKNKSPYNLEE